MAYSTRSHVAQRQAQIRALVETPPPVAVAVDAVRQSGRVKAKNAASVQAVKRLLGG